MKSISNLFTADCETNNICLRGQPCGNTEDCQDRNDYCSGGMFVMSEFLNKEPISLERKKKHLPPSILEKLVWDI